MKWLKRSARLLLEREGEKLRALLSPLWKRRLSGAARSPGKTPEGGAPRSSSASPGEHASGKRRLAAALASLSLSLLLHAMVFYLLFLYCVPAGAPGGGLQGEYIMTLRLIVPRRAPEAEKPPPPLRAAAPEVPPRMPVQGQPLGAEEAPVSNAAPAPPAAAGADTPTRLPELAAAFPLPPLGIGGSPPPLPGGGRGRDHGLANGLQSRTQGKGEALARYGGTAATEDAVGRGLRWLAEHQDEDGGWSTEGFARHCRHFVPCAGEGLREFNVGVSALATLGFLGAGHLPDQEDSLVVSPGEGAPYRRHVRKALSYLLSHQDGSGAYGAVGQNYNYNHAIAALAMAEAYAMTGVRRYGDSAQAAIHFTVAAQQTRGGWDYTAEPTGRNDLSVSGWQVMALRAALQAGLNVPESVLTRARDFVASAVTPGGEGIYADRGLEAGRRGANMVAAGLLAKLYLGALPAERPLQLAAERLLKEPPDWRATQDWERTFQSYYYWYTATLALFHLGGDEWKAWNYFLVRTLLPLQSEKVHEAGSWPPESSWVGVSGGRVYATAVAVLTLETYYRYEPLAQSRKG